MCKYSTHAWARHLEAIGCLSDADKKLKWEAGGKKKVADVLNCQGNGSDPPSPIGIRVNTQQLAAHALAGAMRCQTDAFLKKAAIS